MEQVYYQHHQQIQNFFIRHTTHRTRFLLEHLVLILAVSTFCMVTISHVKFIYRDRSHCLADIVGYRSDVHVTKVLIEDWYSRSLKFDDSGLVAVTNGALNMSSLLTCQSPSNGCSAMDDNRDICVGGEMRLSRELLDNHVIYSYSEQQGFLLLPSEIQLHHNITFQYIVLSHADVKCFGEPFLQSLIFRFSLSSTIILNSILSLHPPYVHHHPTSFTLPHPSRTSNILVFKLTILLTSLFLFFITTTLVSFTLRETQERMLKFTILLQRRIRQRESYGSLVVRHVADMLVFVPITTGVLFFMVQFFDGDRVLAFLVLSVVWSCEAFSVIGMRSVASVRFFPRVFYLYFTLFCAYVLSCPQGFRYLSLLSTVLFLWHGMLFFWNRYELAVGTAPATEREGGMGMRMRSFPSVSSLSGRILSFPSISSFSQIRRAESSENVLFLGEDDESYGVFMDGEVVMHRERTNNAHATTNQVQDTTSNQTEQNSSNNEQLSAATREEDS